MSMDLDPHCRFKKRVRFVRRGFPRRYAPSNYRAENEVQLGYEPRPGMVVYQVTGYHCATKARRRIMEWKQSLIQ